MRVAEEVVCLWRGEIQGRPDGLAPPPPNPSTRGPMPGNIAGNEPPNGTAFSVDGSDRRPVGPRLLGTGKLSKRPRTAGLG